MLNDEQKTIIKTLSNLGKPATGKQVAETAGLDPKKVSNEIKSPGIYRLARPMQIWSHRKWNETDITNQFKLK